MNRLKNFRREVYEINPELKRRLPSLELLKSAAHPITLCHRPVCGDGFLCVE
jgi:hypothetical protein